MCYYTKQEAVEEMEALQIQQKQRYHLLDMLRGLTLISMILYHGTWDLVYLCGNYFYDMLWYQSICEWYINNKAAYVWQQSICWTFIFLSGFCWSMGKQHLKRGLLVFGGGAVVSAVTMLFLWEDRVVFGVLTCIGSCMLLMIPVDQQSRNWNPWGGFAVSAFLFILTRNINRGFLGFEDWNLIRLPGGIYRGLLETYLGFTDPQFYSTDYFSLFPWFFLFLAGYFLYQIMQRNRLFERETLRRVLQLRIPPLCFIGRHSLPIYMLHQPVLYGILQLILLLLSK